MSAVTRAVNDYVDDRGLLNPHNWPGRRSKLVDYLATFQPQQAAQAWALSKYNPEDYKPEDWAKLELKVQEFIALLTELQTKFQDIIRPAVLHKDTQRIVIGQAQASMIFLKDLQPVPQETLAEIDWPFQENIYFEPQEPVPITGNKDHTTLLHGIVAVNTDRSKPDAERIIIYATTVKELLYLTVHSLNLRTGHIERVMDPHQRTSQDDDEDTPPDPQPMLTLLAYLNAKGIEIVEHKLPRQQRRLLQRRNIPNPWHTVQVEPSVRLQNGSETGHETGSHSHRYDVMGHLRYGKHLLKDRSYRHTVEWVKPHQRGLRHELYVPATRHYADIAELDSVPRKTGR